MSNTKTIIEHVSFECPKVGRTVRLEFERRQFFSGEFASPLNETDSAVRGCEGERDWRRKTSDIAHVLGHA
jgi:hypothetical protein